MVCEKQFCGTKPISNNPFPILRIHPMSSANMRRKQRPEWGIRQNSTVVSKSVEFRGVGEGSSRAVGVAPITFICNGIDRGSGSRQGARKRALQAKTGVSCRNVECEAAAAGRARDEK